MQFDEHRGSLSFGEPRQERTIKLHVKIGNLATLACSERINPPNFGFEECGNCFDLEFEMGTVLSAIINDI